MSRVRSMTLSCALAVLAACAKQPDSFTITSLPRGDQLAAPTGLVATAATGSVKLEWNPVSGATAYDVYRSTASASAPARLLAVTGNTVYRDVVGFDNPLVAGTAYHYRIMAKTSTGYDGTPTIIDSPLSAPAAATLTTVPPVSATLDSPTVTVTDVNGTERHISWTEVPNATVYDVYRANTYQSYVDQASPLSLFSAVATNVPTRVVIEAIDSPSTRFAYTVVARKDDGYYMPSVKSALAYSSAVQRLSAPVIAASQGTYADKIVVEWTKIPGATSYRVFRAESRNTTSPDTSTGAVVAPFALVPDLTTFSTLQGTTTRLFVEDTANDITATTVEGGVSVPRYYWYKVQALGDATWADSFLGAAAYGQLKPDGAAPYSVIDAPTGVVTINDGVNAYITVRWQKVLASATKLAAVGYDVYRAKDTAGTGFTRIAANVVGLPVAAALDQLEYQDASADLERGANYYYRIVARSAIAGLESELSASSGAGYIAGLDPFTSFTATQDGSNNLLFTWSAIRNIRTGAGTAYEIRWLPSTTPIVTPLTQGTAIVTIGGASSDLTSSYSTAFSGGAFTPGLSYQFWIIATGNDGQQSYSAPVTLTR